MIKFLKAQYLSILSLVVLVSILAVTASAQGILDPRLLRQNGATNGQALTWSSSNGVWQPGTISSGIQSLNGLTGATQTFADVDDTNVTVTISSTGTTHTWTLGWTSVLALSRGGTGADLSATGGANQFVRQSTLGGTLSVSTIADGDLPETHTMDHDSIGVTSTDALILQNSTAAAAGAQQWSPRIRFTAQGWKTDATAASQTTDWIIENQTTQDDTRPASELVFSSQVNGGGYTPVFRLANWDTGLQPFVPGGVASVEFTASHLIAAGVSGIDQILFFSPTANTAGYLEGQSSFLQATGGFDFTNTFGALRGNTVWLEGNQTGTITSMVGYQSYADLENTGSVTSLKHFEALTPETFDTGSFGTVYGLYVRNQNAGVTNNFSLFTESGNAEINTGAAGTVGLRIDGAGSQTANLQEWRNSTPTVVASVDPAGVVDASGFEQGGAALNFSHLAGSATDAQVPNTITLDNITQITTRDHGSLTGLTDDDHTQYALLAGRATGQTLIGGTASGDDLTFNTTSNVTKGSYFFTDLTSNGFMTTSGGTGVVSITSANAGTDITADLEEETHASEHAENAADELLVESLGTACTVGQTYASDGSGGVDCADASEGVTTTYNTWANLPAAGTAGNLFKSSDSPYECRDNGSSWDCWALGEDVTIPDNSGYSDLSGGALDSVVTTTGTINYTHNGAASISIKGRQKNIGSNLEACFIRISGSGVAAWAGLYLVETGTGKIVTYHINHSGDLKATKWTNRTTFSGDYTLGTGISAESGQYLSPICMKIEWQATNRVMSIKRPGMGDHWYTMHTVAKNDFATTGFDQWGFVANSENSDPVQVVIWHLGDN